MELQDELILALHNLVKLKEHKDENGKDEFYIKHQPHVWEYAKHVLKLCEGKETSHESSRLIKSAVTVAKRKVCPQCGRKFKTTEVKSGIFCCTACEFGY